MNAIRLNKFSINSQMITYNFSVPQTIEKYINPEYIDQNSECNLFIELPDEMIGEEIPESIISIPFVGTMMGIAMLYHVPIVVKELDTVYYNSIAKIENVFNKMYPKGKLKLIVKSEKLTITKKERSEGKTSVFFTGGVDATSALVGILDKLPLLLNIVGGDITLSDQEAHEKLEEYFMCLKNQIAGLDFCFVKSNCRSLFREYVFDKDFRKFISREHWGGYWASIAHIVVMTAIIAPVLYSKNVSTHFIGSSYVSQNSNFDANNEELIDTISYWKCKFISADANLDRNDKMSKIVQYSKVSNVYFKLQVCWYKKNGTNCCRCEKCYRTIMNVLAANGDPNKFGLKYDEETGKEIKRYLETSPVKPYFWVSTQNIFKKERNYWKDTELAWFLDFKFNRVGTYFHKAMKVVRKKLNI